MNMYPDNYYNHALHNPTAIISITETWQTIVLDILHDLTLKGQQGRYRLENSHTFIPKGLTENDIRLANMALNEGNYHDKADWLFTSDVIYITDIWKEVDEALTRASIGFIRATLYNNEETMDSLVYKYLEYLVGEGKLLNLNTHINSINESSYKLGQPTLPASLDPTGLLPVRLVHPNAKIPTRTNPTDAGLDLYATETIVIPAHGSAEVDFGIQIEIPPYFGGFLYARSGLGTKEGITPRNCVGVIDSSYRGNLKATLSNDTDKDYLINVHDRVCQIVISPVILLTPQVVEVLSATDRGETGFGQSGK